MGSIYWECMEFHALSRYRRLQGFKCWNQLDCTIRSDAGLCSLILFGSLQNNEVNRNFHSIWLQRVSLPLISTVQILYLQLILKQEKYGEHCLLHTSKLQCLISFNFAILQGLADLWAVMQPMNLLLFKSVPLLFIRACRIGKSIIAAICTPRNAGFNCLLY